MHETQDLSDDGSGEDYRPLHEHLQAPDSREMQKKLRKKGKRARTPPSMRPFIVDTDAVRNSTYHCAMLRNSCS